MVAAEAERSEQRARTIREISKRARAIAAGMHRDPVQMEYPSRPNTSGEDMGASGGGDAAEALSEALADGT